MTTRLDPYLEPPTDPPVEPWDGATCGDCREPWDRWCGAEGHYVDPEDDACRHFRRYEGDPA